MQLAKEVKTAGASNDKQSEHQTVNDKSLQPEENWKLQPIMKQGYVTKKPQVRMSLLILTRPIKETKENNKLKAP